MADRPLQLLFQFEYLLVALPELLLEGLVHVDYLLV